MIDVFNPIHTHKGLEALHSGIIMTVLTTIAVGLRFMAKGSVKAKYGIDDFFVAFAQLLWFVQFGLQVHGIKEGRAATSLIDPHEIEYFKMIYIYAEFYFPMVLFINLSILFFYRSIFSIETWVKRVTTGLIVLNVLWALAGFFTETFMCVPVHVTWDDLLAYPTKCIWYSSFFLAIMIVELVLDVLLLAVPVIKVATLHLSWQTRAMVAGIFLLGGFVVITAIIRIVECYTYGSQGVDLVADIFWLDIHVGTAIICACLPTYRPLFKNGVQIARSSIKKLSSGASDSATPKGYSSSPSRDGANSKISKEGKTSSDEAALVKVTGGWGPPNISEHDLRGDSRNGEGINVERTYQVV